MILGGWALGIEAVTITSMGWISSATGCPSFTKYHIEETLVQHWPLNNCNLTWTSVTWYQAFTYSHTSLSFSWALTCAMWFSVCWNDCINSWFCTNKLCKRLGPSSPERHKINYITRVQFNRKSCFFYRFCDLTWSDTLTTKSYHNPISSDTL